MVPPISLWYKKTTLNITRVLHRNSVTMSKDVGSVLKVIPVPG